MNISPLMPQVNSFQNPSTAQKIATQYYHQENIELNINYSDQDTIINLSLSSSVTYMETTYNEKGMIPGLSNRNSGVDSILPRGITETDVAIQEIDSFVDNVLDNYLQLIRERVEYLLKQLTEKNSGISDFTGVNRSNTITGLLDFSPQITADRIISFALSFYDGGDREEFAAMVREAVMKGFNEAMKAFGGSLPQESYETIRIVNAALDDFTKSGNIDFSA